MFGFLKKKDTKEEREPEQKLLWDTQTKDTGIVVQDYLVPASEMLPPWYKGMKNVIDPVTGLGNARTCPNFNDLFGNSLVLMSPCEFSLDVGHQAFKMKQPDNAWFKVTSHTILKGMPSQMGPDWDPNLANIKLNTNLVWSVNHGEIQVVFLPPFYHAPRTDLQVAPGTFTVTPNIVMDLNLLTFVDLAGIAENDAKRIRVKSGDPLAMIFFPAGIPAFEKADLFKRPRKTYINNHVNALREYREAVNKPER